MKKTKDGAPRSIEIPASSATLQEVVFARAGKAIQEIRKQAAESGAAALTCADIDQEIAASRRERRQRARRG